MMNDTITTVVYANAYAARNNLYLLQDITELAQLGEQVVFVFGLRSKKIHNETQYKKAFDLSEVFGDFFKTKLNADGIEGLICNNSDEYNGSNVKFDSSIYGRLNVASPLVQSSIGIPVICDGKEVAAAIAKSVNADLFVAGKPVKSNGLLVPEVSYADLGTFKADSALPKVPSGYDLTVFDLNQPHGLMNAIAGKYSTHIYF